MYIYTQAYIHTHLQKLQGIVRRVETFGAFVDVGAERNGLMHVSELSRDREQGASDVLKIGECVSLA
jgi:transcriptional accessory protein Tex/SPT6